MQITIVKSKLNDPKFGDRPRYRVYDHEVTEDQVEKNTRVEFSWDKACAAVVRLMLRGESATVKVLEVSKEIPDPDSITNRVKKETPVEGTK